MLIGGSNQDRLRQQDLNGPGLREACVGTAGLRRAPRHLGIEAFEVVALVRLAAVIVGPALDQGFGALLGKAALAHASACAAASASSAVACAARPRSRLAVASSSIGPCSEEASAASSRTRSASISAALAGRRQLDLGCAAHLLLHGDEALGALEPVAGAGRHQPRTSQAA